MRLYSIIDLFRLGGAALGIDAYWAIFRNQVSIREKAVIVLSINFISDP